MNSSRDISTPGLYVHIPFCQSKCHYCGFFSVIAASLIPRWLNAVDKEIALYKNRFNRFDSLYLGGGTPTILAIGALANLLEHIFSHFDFDPNSEITIEANPCDLTNEKIRALKDMGVNRVSLGVQSFDDRVLGFLGRNHTAGQAENSLKDLRSLGFENISLDLIYGIEGQSKEKWIDTLNRAVSFQPEHLSCYQLTVEKKSLFGRLVEKGRFQPLDEKDEQACFVLTSEVLEQNGYIHYEISSFARDQALYSRHNCKYWQHAPYLGLGPSAHSFYGSNRWWNIRSVRKYCEMLEGGRPPVDGFENLSAEQSVFEAIMLGLRTKEGFDQSMLPKDPQSEGTLCRLQASGFVRVDRGRVVPTRKGFLVADHLACSLTGK